MAIDFGDLASRYAQNRWDQATQPFTDPEGYLNRRIENDYGIDMNGNVKPKSTTINYNDDGSKSITTKHEVPAEPAVPQQTVQQPQPQAVAQPAPAVPQQAIAQPQPQPVPQTGPAVPQAPMVQTAAPAPMPQGGMNRAPDGSWNDYQDQTQLPPEQRMPTERPAPVQAVAPAAPAEVAPVAPAGQMVPAAIKTPQTQPQPVVPAAEAAAPAEVAPPPAVKTDWQTSLENAKGDERKYAALIANENTPEEIRKLASERMHRDATLRLEGKKVEDVLRRVAENDPRATNDLVRYQKSQKEDGSILRAVLYARLGLNDLAREEQGKLSGGNIENLALGNQYYTVVRDARGGISKAFDAEGKTVDDATVAKLNAEAFALKGAQTGQTMGKDAKGNVISHTILPNGRGVVWKNETTGETLKGAPEGYHSMSSKTAEEIADIKGIGTAAQIETKMRKANTDAVALGLPVPYSEEAIANEKAKVSKVAQGTAAAGAPTPGKAPAPAAGEAPAATTAPATTGAVRNNNPGNIRYGDFAKSMGATGKDERGFAIFPDMTVGDTAQQKLLSGDAYKNMTLSQIVSKWAPNTDRNNPAQYAKSMKQMTGLDMDKTYNELTPEEQKKFREAQTKIEHGVSATAPSAAAPYKSSSSVAEKIANYEMKPPASRSAQYGPLMQEVAKINPNYDETKFATVQQARKNFTTGKQGDSVRSMNVAIDHLDTLREAGQALQNGNLPIFNKIANEYTKNTGDNRLTDFNGIKSIVGSEVAKAVAGGQMALADREEIRKELDAANSPQQLAGVIKRMQQLLGGQLKGLKTQYEDAGLRDFDKKLTPRTKSVLGGMAEEKKNTNNTRSNW
jgi:hypothetical protein